MGASGDGEGSDLQLVDELLESGLEAVISSSTLPARETGRDVEKITLPRETGREVEKIMLPHDTGRDMEKRRSVRDVEIMRTGRDVEIMRSAAGNGVVESMKIVVNNHNGSKDEPVTVSSSEDGGMEQQISEENSREENRKIEEFTLDSSDFLHIDEDLNLEEL